MPHKYTYKTWSSWSEAYMLLIKHCWYLEHHNNVDCYRRRNSFLQIMLKIASLFRERHGHLPPPRCSGKNWYCVNSPTYMSGNIPWFFPFLGACAWPLKNILWITCCSLVKIAVRRRIHVETVRSQNWTERNELSLFWTWGRTYIHSGLKRHTDNEKQ